MKNNNEKEKMIKKYEIKIKTKDGNMPVVFYDYQIKQGVIVSDPFKGIYLTTQEDRQNKIFNGEFNTFCKETRLEEIYEEIEDVIRGENWEREYKDFFKFIDYKKLANLATEAKKLVKGSPYVEWDSERQREAKVNLPIGKEIDVIVLSNLSKKQLEKMEIRRIIL